MVERGCVIDTFSTYKLHFLDGDDHHTQTLNKSSQFLSELLIGSSVLQHAPSDI